jgi:hypothetical protein
MTYPYTERTACLLLPTDWPTLADAVEILSLWGSIPVGNSFRPALSPTVKRTRGVVVRQDIGPFAEQLST